MMDLHEIEEKIRNCTNCPLHKTRTNAVPGEGPANAKIMLVGEAPGRFEDIQGRPFVGAAGKLLTKILSEVGINRDEVYITNVVKCRPPNNRDPTDEEIAKCSPYLDLQIAAIKPKLIIALGRHSGKYLIEKFGGKFGKISAIHGKLFHFSTLFGSFYLMATYHPAAAIYNKSLYSSIVEDISNAIREIQL